MTQTHRDELRLLGLFPDSEQAVDNKPVENRLDPVIVLGNRAVPDKRGELVDDPCAPGVQSLHFRAASPRDDVSSLILAAKFSWDRCTHPFAPCSSLTRFSKYSM